MGDPKRRRKRYNTPVSPWEGERIEEERKLNREYGFKNKEEIWKMDSILKNFFLQAKKLIAEDQGKEREQLLSRLKHLGLISGEAGTDDILNLKLKDILERRLQTLVFRKGKARSMKQARQFITHGHITAGGKKISSPGALISKDAEDSIDFIPKSSLSSPEHPERAVPEEEEKLPKKPKKDKETKKEEKPKGASEAGKKTEKKEKPSEKKESEKKEEKKKSPKSEEIKEKKKDKK